MALLLILATPAFIFATELANHLQDVSVTIRSGNSSGSGTIITRKAPVSPGSEETVSVNFIWTAAHVVDNLRSVRSIIDPATGTTRKVVEFKDAEVVRELIEDGRKVGETKMLAKVIKYSDSENGQDLAILMVRKLNFVSVNSEFYLGDDIVPVGTTLFHVGSLLGQVGSNSMTSGIMSQVGRILPIGNKEGVVFDQTTATAFPGSSGGGVFMAGLRESERDKNWSGQYIGMLVRGGGETFNFIVPVRRMRRWADAAGVTWAIDPSSQIPSLDELRNLDVDDTGVNFSAEGGSRSPKSIIKYPFFLGYE